MRSSTPETKIYFTAVASHHIVVSPQGCAVVAIICPSLKLADYNVAFTSYWNREIAVKA